MKLSNLSKFRFFTFFLLISFLLQTFLPLNLFAQQGIFVGGEGTRDGSLRSRTEEEGIPSLGSGGLSDKAAGVGSAMTRRQLEGMEGSSIRESLGASGLMYQIHILGEVIRPGTYRIGASTRLSEALQIAGGIKKNGSDRNVELRRASTTKKVDLISYKVFGHLEDNPYLMDNDVIFIPLRKRVVQVEGSVNRPGIYELNNERSILDIFKLAGGMTQGVSHKDPIRIIRFDENEKKDIVEITNNPETLSQTLILNGDVIIVPHMFTTQNKFDYNLNQLPNDNIFYPSFEDRVFVIGAVAAPGAYNFNHNYHLSHYLAVAGGATRMAKGYVKVMGIGGEVKKLKPDSDILINPGDTIYIPERIFSRDSWVSLVTSLISFGLATTTTIVTLTNNN